MRKSETDATIGYGATIGNRATIIQTFSIKGTKHLFQYWETDQVKIGCELHKIEHWKENIAEIGKKNGYAEAEIAEYRRYLDFATADYKE